MRDVVSVVIVTFQSQDDILPCLRSLLASALSLDVIIVDNASSDETVARVERAIAGRSDCRLICNCGNIGFARAVNQGIAWARGDNVLLLNPDCVLERDTLAIALDALRRRLQAGAAGCLLLNEDASEQAGARRYLPSPWRSMCRALLLHKLFPHDARFSGFLMNREPLPPGPVEVEATSGAFMLVKRAVIEQVGRLDEGYFMHCEDLDWCVRMRQAGWQVLFVPAARAVHKKGRSSRARPIRVELYKHVGMVRFYRKFFLDRYPALLSCAVVVAVWMRFAFKVAALLPGTVRVLVAMPLARPVKASRNTEAGARRPTHGTWS
jgi:hypothetical protein